VAIVTVESTHNGRLISPLMMKESMIKFWSFRVSEFLEPQISIPTVISLKPEAM
jgi:hypothetical protein